MSIFKKSSISTFRMTKKMSESFGSRPVMCFEVEKVIGVSSDGSYQVQWAPAWVSKFHLVGCEHLIQEFLQQQQQSQQQHQQTLQQQQQQQQQTLQQQHQQYQQPLQQDENIKVGENENIPQLENGITQFPISEEDEPHFMDDLQTQDTAFPCVKVEEEEGEVKEPSEILDIHLSKPFTSTCDNNSRHSTPYVSNDIHLNNLEADPTVQKMNSFLSNTTSTHNNKLHFTPHNIEVDPTRMHSEENSCPTCGKCFSDSRTLHQHQLTHTREKKHKCEHCEKSFAMKGHLTEHIRIHTGEKPHGCDVCGRMFRRRQHLDRHMLTHIDDEQYHTDDPAILKDL